MDVKTAGRTVDLFEIFAEAGTPLTLSEIARALNAPQSSCFNLVRTLESRGYLYSVGGNKRVYPTRKLLDCAQAIAGYEPVIPRLRPIMKALSEQVDETVILGAFQGKQAIYLVISEGKQTIRYIARAGELKPLHASAIGKALLMGLPEKAREKLVRSLTFDVATEATITNPEELLAELKASKERGYAMTAGEHVADVGAVACSLAIDNVTYSLAIAGPTSRIVPSGEQLAAEIKSALRALNRSSVFDED